MDKALLIAIGLLALTILMSLYRAVVGPTRGDRVISINVIGTKTLVLVAMVAVYQGATSFLDVILVFALISFLASLVISRELEKGDRNE